jgi:hypothetical protein
MMEQGTLFEDMPIRDKSDKVFIGGRLFFLKSNKSNPNKAFLYKQDCGSFRPRGQKIQGYRQYPKPDMPD